MVEVAKAVVGAVGVDEFLCALQPPVQRAGSDNQVHGGIVSVPQGHGHIGGFPGVTRQSRLALPVTREIPDSPISLPC